MKPKEYIPLVDTSIFRLHGDLSQVDRTSATSKFRTAGSGILLATDVAARGLDFPDVDWIVQFDPPSDTKVWCVLVALRGCVVAWSCGCDLLVWLLCWVILVFVKPLGVGLYF